MHHLFALALLTALGTTSASPLQKPEPATFPKGTTWDIILDKENVTLAQIKAENVPVVDIDLFENEKDGSIKQLNQTKKVICYFSAGSREDWRDDANDFKWPDDYGKNMSDPEDTWKGENWVNVKSANVKKIMKKRILRAAAAGCHAIDPDNIDGFDGNQDGYNYEKSDYVAYVNWLAATALESNLTTGLKNAIDLIPDVLPNIAFAVNEQCHEPKLNDCGSYKPFTDANKAVFNIEYNSTDCSQPAGVVLSEVIKPDKLLGTLGGQCR